MSGESMDDRLGSGDVNWSTVGDPLGLGTAEYSGVPMALGFAGETMTTTTVQAIVVMVTRLMGGMKTRR